MEPVKLRTKTTAKKSNRTGRPSHTTLCEHCGNAFIPSPYHPSPTRDTFRSNALSDEDATKTREILEEEETELSRYDEELARLSQLAKKLGSERRGLQKRVLERRNLLSAMRKLPVEIWEEILSTAVASWPGYAGSGPEFPINYSLYVHYNRCGGSDPHSGEVFTPPLVLSQVSSHWRNILRFMPRLWSSISVDVYGLMYDIRPLLKTYFEKSRNHPLKIELIDTEWAAYDEEDLDLEEWESDGYDHGIIRSGVFEDLMKEMHRCQELLLDLSPAGSLLRLGEPPMAITFPLLHSLSVRSMSNVASGRSSWFWGAIRKAPQLVDFAMTHHFIDIDTIPCQQIQSLTIDNPIVFTRTVRSLLKFPQLESLTVNKQLGEWGPNIPGGVVLKSVRNLTIDIHDIWNILEFLAPLTLPSLISLKLVAKYGRADSRNWPWHLFEEMVQRSSCSLETLTLDLGDSIITASAQELLKVLHVLPSLADFTLVVRSRHSKAPALRASVSHLMSKLSLPNGETAPKSVLIPSLTMFSLQFDQKSTSVLKTGVSEEFLSFAESRCRQRLAALGLTDKVASLLDVSLIIHNNSSSLSKEEKVAVSPFEGAGFLQRLRALTRDGMLCTVDERVPAE
ncbi:hypothetical protein Moror_12831 [Moniliophthora roreri MCA 2997]|uniref:F-box domain-containing protein n=2 Tax=Moniliophthora roreri TaxID=221103 RepID=V2XMJ8_MONRO|nr:hypothetical protein Moror_12831 [Moniliophthora roreri MCA 2997]